MNIVQIDYGMVQWGHSTLIPIERHDRHDPAPIDIYAGEDLFLDWRLGNTMTCRLPCRWWNSQAR